MVYPRVELNDAWLQLDEEERESERKKAQERLNEEFKAWSEHELKSMMVGDPIIGHDDENDMNHMMAG